VSDAAVLKDKSIKAKFEGSKDKTGAEGVREAFLELSAFIKNGGLTNGVTQNVIQLGDYIDLEGGLAVFNYNKAGSFWSESDIHWDSGLTLDDAGAGKMMRLIVVGINSFKPKSPYAYQYQGKDTPPPHVVFQFQHVPVTRRMNETGSSADGYPKSEMRKYLTPVKDSNGAVVTGSGNFLAGLLEAGLPKDVLWGLSRRMATDKTKGTAIIDDLLWLPTEREVYGGWNQGYFYSVETEITQAWLEYYTSAKSAKKLSKDITNYPEVTAARQYWLASMYGVDEDTTKFCTSSGSSGNPSSLGAGYTIGVYGGPDAPAGQ
jgi:hypothetical protein